MKACGIPDCKKAASYLLRGKPYCQDHYRELAYKPVANPTHYKKGQVVH